jgi:uncharacterized protein with HEPN domain
MQDTLDAIARARVADKRMRLAESLGDDVGVQVAFQAILHNLSVISESVKAIPTGILERDTTTPWSEFVEMRAVIRPNYPRMDPTSLHRIVETGLGQLDVAVRRLRATQ